MSKINAIRKSRARFAATMKSFKTLNHAPRRQGSMKTIIMTVCLIFIDL